MNCYYCNSPTEVTWRNGAGSYWMRCSAHPRVAQYVIRDKISILSFDSKKGLGAIQYPTAFKNRFEVYARSNPDEVIYSEEKLISESWNYEYIMSTLSRISKLKVFI